MFRRCGSRENNSNDLQIPMQCSSGFRIHVDNNQVPGACPIKMEENIQFCLLKGGNQSHQHQRKFKYLYISESRIGNNKSKSNLTPPLANRSSDFLDQIQSCPPEIEVESLKTSNAIRRAQNCKAKGSLGVSKDKAKMMKRYKAQTLELNVMSDVRMK